MALAASATLALAALVPMGCAGFAPISPTYGVRQLKLPASPRIASLAAKKKKKGAGGKGFGKALTQPDSADDTPAQVASYDDATESFESSGLTSIEGAPATSSSDDILPKVDIDPNLPPEERTKEILRKRYGLKTAEETEADFEKSQRDAEKAKSFKKQQKRLETYRQMKDEEFDIFKVIPAPILVAIDFFLKAGTAIVTVLFVMAGIGITVEAWAAATGNKLPEDLDNFIVNVVEPNFTPALFVLLGFSVSLGLFASAQLGSGSSQYSEDP